ncbi:unnamed protein product [Prorocentrum cordatum]|uniref:Uncharacterized protein n=1 Tax=Prorocentrum cordatum TaxID=2364126 RepID=A0ABN9U0J9_9DINO|nr:unnamed protein product [Polarella glacialis]
MARVCPVLLEALTWIFFDRIAMACAFNIMLNSAAAPLAKTRSLAFNLVKSRLAPREVRKVTKVFVPEEGVVFVELKAAGDFDHSELQPLGEIVPLTETEYQEYVQRYNAHKKRKQDQEEGVASMSETVALGKLMLEEGRAVGSKKRRAKTLKAVATMTATATKVTASGLTVRGLKDVSEPKAESEESAEK